MLLLIDRYLIREVVKVLLAITCILLLILTTNLFVKYLAKVAGGLISANVLFSLLGLQVIRLIPLVVPPAFFIAILFTVGRMYRDNEMTAIACCGIGSWRIFRSLFMFVIPLAVFVGYMSLEVTPWTQRMVYDLKEIQKDSAELAGIVPGRFNEYSKGDLVVYVGSISDSDEKMHNIFVQNRQHGELGLIKADTGYQYVDRESGGHYVVLEDGRRYEGNPGQADFSVQTFQRYGVRVALSKEVATDFPRRARPTRTLLESRFLDDRAEVERRLSYPIAVLVFTLLGIPLSRSLPRQNMYGRLFLAGLVYFTYYNLMGVAGAWLEKGVTPVWLGIWWVHGTMLIVIAALIMRDARWMRRIARRRRKPASA